MSRGRRCLLVGRRNSLLPPFWMVKALECASAAGTLRERRVILIKVVQVWKVGSELEYAYIRTSVQYCEVVVM